MDALGTESAENESQAVTQAVEPDHLGGTSVYFSTLAFFGGGGGGILLEAAGSEFRLVAGLIYCGKSQTAPESRSR